MEFKSNKKIFFLIVYILFISLFSKIVFAVWNGNPYTPGAVDNPECLPSQTNCDVLPALTAESDPIFIASQAFTISASDISKWKDTYSWGNHANAGYVTGTPWTSMGYLTSFTEMDPIFNTWLSTTPPLYSFTETDPIFSAWNKSTGISITESQISDLQKYLTSYTETDPIYSVSQAHNITSTDITNLGNLSGTNSGDETNTSIKNKLGISILSGSNTGDQDLSGLVPYSGGTTDVNLGAHNITATTFIGSLTGTASSNEVPLTFSNGLTRTSNEIKNNLITGTTGAQTILGSTGGNGLVVDAGRATQGGANQAGGDLTLKAGISTGAGSSAMHFYTTPVAVIGYAIGDTYGGGKIAYILQPGDPGYDVTKIKGLIAATSDQGPTVWWNGSNITTGTVATALGTGSANTDTIIAAQGAGSYAASLARSYNGGGYSDWYLPSKDELNKLWLNKTALGIFNIWWFFSSSEYSSDTAWAQLGSNGQQSSQYKNYNTGRYIPVRSFSIDVAGTTDNTPTERLTILGNGLTGIGVTTPLSRLHLAAGSATSNTAPLQFNSGTLETTARAGVVEFLTDAYYGTITTGASRKNFIQNNLGFTGGQTLIGGTAVTDKLVLQGTTGNGTLTSPAIQMNVGNAGGTTALTVLNNGNVGIGTTSPTASLHILNSGTYPQVMLGLQRPAGAGYWGITFGNEAVSNMYIGRADTSQTTGYFWRANWNTAGVAGNTFQNADTAGGTGLTTVNVLGINNQTADLLAVSGYGQTMGNLFKVQSNGNVGIGTTAPTAMLSVGASNQFTVTSAGAVKGISFYSTGVGGSQIYLNSANNFGTIQNDASDVWSLGYRASQGGLGTPVLSWNASGNVGIGLTSPTAYLNIKAGTATAGTAPIKLTSGTLNTTAEAGAIEFNTDAYYGTITTGASRKNFIQNNLGFTGGQTIIGGTAITDKLVLQGTTGNGTLTSPAIQMNVGNAGATNALTVLNNGNVGIGVINPAYPLEVNGLINGIYIGLGGTKLYSNVAIGTGALSPLTGNNHWNTAVGYDALGLINSGGGYNTAIGSSAGYYYTAFGYNRNATSSVYIGSGTMALANGGTNEIVIGVSAVGNGSNSVTLGNTNITKTILQGNIGIGTTTPNTARLEVVGNYGGAFSVASNDTGVTGNYSLNIVNTDTTVNNRSNIWFGDNVASASATIGAVHINHTSDYADLSFATRGTDGFLDRMRILSNGNVGIGTTSPSTKLEIGSSDLGDGVAGPVITLGRNTNATNTGAGSINFLDKAGNSGYVWQDAAGKLRINTSTPSNANDTSGNVIGDQTSTRDTKQDINDYSDYENALSMIVNAPLHTFRYIKEVNGYGADSLLAKTRIGFIADEVDPMFMVGNSIDQVSVNGLLMASIKEMNLKLESLAVPIDENNIKSFIERFYEKLTAWLGSPDNGIEKICVKKSDGTSFCVNGDQLEQAVNGMSATTTPPPSTVTPVETAPVVEPSTVEPAQTEIPAVTEPIITAPDTTPTTTTSESTTSEQPTL